METLQIIRFIVIVVAVALCPLVILQAIKIKRLSKEFCELATKNAKIVKEFNDKLTKIREGSF